MKKLVFYFLILLLAIWLGLKIAVDPGYVFISYHKTSIEMTFWFFLLLIALIFGAFYLISTLFLTSKILPKKLHHWTHDRRAKKAIRFTEVGLVKLMNGSWHKAEQCVIKASKASPIPLLNFLLGAYAAQKLKQFWKRDHYIARAIKGHKKSETTIRLIQIKMQIEAKQYEQALAALNELRRIRPNQRIVLELLQTIYLRTDDFVALLNLLPDLRKYRALSKENFLELEEKIYLELSKTAPELDSLWATLPKKLQSVPEIVVNYVNHLLSKNEVSKAEKILVKVLGRNWHPSLIDCYGAIISKDPNAQLARAEKWLTAHNDDPNLLLCLGRLCKRQTLWAKAKSYLERSSVLEPRAETFYELGQVMEAQNNVKAALDYYRKR